MTKGKPGCHRGSPRRRRPARPAAFDPEKHRSDDRRAPQPPSAVGDAARFHGALKLAACHRAGDVGGSGVAVTIGLLVTTVSASALIQAELPGVDQSVARDLVARAHGGCSYSKATRPTFRWKLTSSRERSGRSRWGSPPTPDLSQRHPYTAAMSTWFRGSCQRCPNRFIA